MCAKKKTAKADATAELQQTESELPVTVETQGATASRAGGRFVLNFSNTENRRQIIVGDCDPEKPIIVTISQ